MPVKLLPNSEDFSRMAELDRLIASEKPEMRKYRRCHALGCKRTVWARDLCAKHYQMLRLHGDPNWKPPMRKCLLPECMNPTREVLCRKHYKLAWNRSYYALHGRASNRTN